MATLKECKSVVLHGIHVSKGHRSTHVVSIRLKSVKNIEKITKSMKMVSAAKYSQAERQLRPARTYGVAAQGIYNGAVGPSLLVVLYWST